MTSPIGGNKDKGKYQAPGVNKDPLKQTLRAAYLPPRPTGSAARPLTSHGVDQLRGMRDLNIATGQETQQQTTLLTEAPQTAPDPIGQAEPRAARQSLFAPQSNIQRKLGIKPVTEHTEEILWQHGRHAQIGRRRAPATEIQAPTTETQAQTAETHLTPPQENQTQILTGTGTAVEETAVDEPRLTFAENVIQNEPRRPRIQKAGREFKPLLVQEEYREAAKRLLIDNADREGVTKIEDILKEKVSAIKRGRHTSVNALKDINSNKVP